MKLLITIVLCMVLVCFCGASGRGGNISSGRVAYACEQIELGRFPDPDPFEHNLKSWIQITGYYLTDQEFIKVLECM